MRARRPLLAVLAAVLCAGIAVLVWAAVFRTGPGQAADVAAFRGFVQLQGTAAAPVAGWVSALCDVETYALLVGALALYALVARGPRWAVAVLAVTFATNAATQVLKPALAAPRMVGPLHTGEHVVAASWPSGHSTAAMALALCAVMVAPAAWRWTVAAVGGLFAVAVAYSVVLLGWHLPSDALGGFAVAGAGTALALALLWSAQARWPVRPAAPVATAQTGLTTALALAVVAAVVLRTAAWLPSLREQVAFVVLAAAIVGLALALSAVAARAQRT